MAFESPGSATPTPAFVHICLLWSWWVAPRPYFRGVIGDAGGTAYYAYSIIWVPGGNSDRIFEKGRGDVGILGNEHSEIVNESFWDTPGVEIEAKQVLG